MRIPGPAKINLALAVGPVDARGYHELATVYCALDLADEITVEAAPAGSGVRCTVTGRDATLVPSGPGNLAVAAAHRLAAAYDVEPDVTITIDKHIPVAGGLAGGSTDAAAVLTGLARLWHLPSDRLPQIAADLGSDVPFCLSGGLATGHGRGELVTRLPTPPVAYDWVIAIAPTGLSTPTVFAELDRQRATGRAPDRPEFDAQALLADQVAALSPALTTHDPQQLAQVVAEGNDLQRATLVLRPELRDLFGAAERLGAVTTIVSGSGPTCLSLCTGPDSATTVADGLRSAEVCADAVVTRSCSL